jgi:hypothetical protein
VDTNRNWGVDWGVKEKDYDPNEEFPGKAPHRRAGLSSLELGGPDCWARKGIEESVGGGPGCLVQQPGHRASPCRSLARRRRAPRPLTALLLTPGLPRSPFFAPPSEPEVQVILAEAKDFKPHVWLNVHSGMQALFTPYDHKPNVSASQMSGSAHRGPALPLFRCLRRSCGAAGRGRARHGAPATAASF